ncbi:hypothetical protein JHL18_24760 [Clostridium sp. YIM B02505]|uniref:Uncharacterized protein n=1 Tax=Clostridium yunnanense TaxID=2800325 RepID=A0ABS1EWW8_9CLOT|nr:hypothetical protein [Clostridium yunnanense]MBK1813835.1 hypothetical protein [Clostridium yunnanense]
MDEDHKNEDITADADYFTGSTFFKRKEIKYILKVFGLSLILYILAGNFVITEGSSESNISNISSITYFLALIASVLVVNGYDKAKENSSEK